MQDKTSWFIRLNHPARPEVVGIGECGPLPGLSVDDVPDFEDRLSDLVARINASGLDSLEAVDRLVPPRYPALRFGLETAWRDLAHGGRRVIFDNDFIRGMCIPINGLIWMGDLDFMMEQIGQKIADGFRTIKIKVGGLDFQRECDVLDYIRRKYFRENITLRLDANGAFTADDVFHKLKELSAFDIHSIEQPLKPGMEEMEEVCRKSPIPIAFDEELIGVHGAGMKALVERLRPQYIVLKPTLHGGLGGAQEWIRLASAQGIGWWMTSALESSVGLNAICQFTAEFKPAIPQGLGTGTIYENNISSPLTVAEGQIFHDPNKRWNALDDSVAG